jgi:hypothetical protein
MRNSTSKYVNVGKKGDHLDIPVGTFSLMEFNGEQVRGGRIAANQSALVELDANGECIL